MKKTTRREPKVISTLKELVYTSAEHFGEKAFYTYKEDGKIKNYLYSDMKEDMISLGTALCDLGLSKSTVAIIGDTHPYMTLTYMSVVNGGGIIVPLDRELSLSAVCDFVNIAGCEAIAYTSVFNGKLTELAEKMPCVKAFIRMCPDENAESAGDVPVYDIGDLLERGGKLYSSGDKRYTEYEIEREKCCAILFTSGTTGTSKGVMLSQKNLCTAINSACQTVPYDDRTRLVSLLPIHHTYEMTCTHLGGMNIGCSVYINPSLKYAARSLAYFKPNAMVVVPLFLETISKKINARIENEGLSGKVKFAKKLSGAALKLGIDLRQKLFSEILAAFGGEVKCITCGGAPLSDSLIRDLYSFGIPVLEGYGITECSPLVSVNPPEAPRFGSVGKPVPGVTVKIDTVGRDENGRGEILVSGDNVMLGYFNNEEATREVFTEDGFFKTGDIGYIDRDGYIFITGRKKNVIILSNGKNVYPEEIEEHLSDADLVKEIVVVARHDEDNASDDICAIIYPDYDFDPDADHEKVKERCLLSLKKLNDKLPAFKQVTVFEFRETEFEKTTTKKIKRFLVK